MRRLGLGLGFGLGLGLGLGGCHRSHRVAQRDAARPAPADAAVAQVAPAPPPDAAAPPVPTKIAVAGATACVVMSDATLRCQGGNAHGQLGDGTTRESKEPVTPRLAHVVDVGLAEDTACALLDDGSVACWGAIGFGPGPSHPLVPTAVAGVTGGKRLFVFPHAGCTTLATGPLVCWGDVDGRGHLGAAGARRVPTPVPGVTDAIAVTPRGVLQADGRVLAWGTADAGLTDVTEIARWGDSLCGLRRDGTVACVGKTPPCAPPPRPAPPAPPSHAPGHGKRTRGKPARPRPARPKSARPGKRAPAAAKPTAPPPKPPPPALSLPRARHLAFDAGLCVVTLDGHLACLDADNHCAPQPSWPGLDHVASVSGPCALLTSGTVRCWSAPRAAARPIPNLTHVTQLSASQSVAGTVLSWHSYVVQPLDFVEPRGDGLK